MSKMYFGYVSCSANFKFYKIIFIITFVLRFCDLKNVKKSRKMSTKNHMMMGPFDLRF